MKRHVDRFAFERELWQDGITLIAGVDEVGRGPLAGPVVVAAVMLPITWLRAGLPAALEGLNDSKQLTARRRERFFQFLTAGGEVSFAIARMEAQDVDEYNIFQADYRAMHEALARLTPSPQHALVEGGGVKSWPFPQTAGVQGDGRSYP